jgi:hypothetical protein
MPCDERKIEQYEKDYKIVMDAIENIRKNQQIMIDILDK